MCSPQRKPGVRPRHHYYSGIESDEDLVGNPPSAASNQASSIRGRPMTRGGRRGRSNARSRGVHHQIDLDETPQDSLVSPLCRTRHPAMTEGRSSIANGKERLERLISKNLLKELVQFVRQWGHMCSQRKA